MKRSWIVLVVFFSLMISTGFRADLQKQNSSYQNGPVNKEMLTNKWWKGDHKMNGGGLHIAGHYFYDNGQVKMKLMSFPFGWKWKGDENIIKIISPYPCEYKVLTLTEYEFVFELNEKVYYMFAVEK